MAGKQVKVWGKVMIQSWFDRKTYVHDLHAAINEVLKGLTRDTSEQIMYEAISDWNHYFLKRTSIVSEEIVPPQVVTDLQAQVLAQEAELLKLRGEAVEESLTPHIRSSILAGLREKNATMVRAAIEYQQSMEAEQFLSNLTINIIPYTIKDTSLEEIILRAPEEIVAKCEAALIKRRRTGRSDPSLPLRWEEEEASRA